MKKSIWNELTYKKEYSLLKENHMTNTFPHEMLKIFKTKTYKVSREMSKTFKNSINKIKTKY